MAESSEGGIVHVGSDDTGTFLQEVLRNRCGKQEKRKEANMGLQFDAQQLFACTPA